MRDGQTPLAAYAGAVLGFLGWMIGWALLCAGTGKWSLLGRTAPIGVAVSLALAAAFVVVLERARRRGVTRRSLARVTLCMTGLAVGALWLLVNRWLAPVIDADPDLSGALERLGAVYATSDLYPILLAAVAGVGLAVTALRARGEARGA